jgi:hypothetical protein
VVAWQTDYDARLQEKDPSPMLKFSAAMFGGIGVQRNQSVGGFSRARIRNGAEDEHRAPCAT